LFIRIFLFTDYLFAMGINVSCGCIMGEKAIKICGGSRLMATHLDWLIVGGDAAVWEASAEAGDKSAARVAGGAMSVTWRYKIAERIFDNFTARRKISSSQRYARCRCRGCARFFIRLASNYFRRTAGAFIQRMNPARPFAMRCSAPDRPLKRVACSLRCGRIKTAAGTLCPAPNNQRGFPRRRFRYRQTDSAIAR
jgi:hypothetical protein